MGLNLDTIRLGIYDWVKSELAGTDVTADKIMWLAQDAPRPARPYVGLNVLVGPGRVGHDALTEVTPGVYDLVGVREMTCSVNVYGERADQFVDQLMCSLEKPTVQERLATFGLAMIEQSDPTDLTALIETRWEARSQFDVRFRVTSKTRDNVGYVQKVELTNQVLGETQVIQ